MSSASKFSFWCSSYYLHQFSIYLLCNDFLCKKCSILFWKTEQKNDATYSHYAFCVQYNRSLTLWRIWYQMQACRRGSSRLNTMGLSSSTVKTAAADTSASGPMNGFALSACIYAQKKTFFKHSNEIINLFCDIQRRLLYNSKDLHCLVVLRSA